MNALQRIYDAHNSVNTVLDIEIYLTDDGSTDGTSQAVMEAFPDVNILEGTGDLYWAGGMRNSWKKALQKGYDGYLLLNDDTNVFLNLFEAYMLADEFSKDKFGRGGVYLGATCDANTKKLTYGGAKITNRFKFKFEHLEPNGHYQACQLGNANIMFVSKDVIEKIGILSKGYVHGVADYDYTLKAVKQKQPVLLMPSYLGECEHDHEDIYLTFYNKTFNERLSWLKSPLGLDFKSNLLLMRKHFPERVPLYLASAGMKLVFPQMYKRLSKLR